MERVYSELKTRVMRGEFAPGERLDPVQLAGTLAASATPVRDALHRLSGERLIDSWHHEGFRQPLMAEAELHDLYAWASALLLLVLSGRNGAPLGAEPPLGASGTSAYADELSRLFRKIAWLSKNRELRYAVASLVDRCHIVRVAELHVDPACRGEVAAMDEDFRFGRWSALRSKLTRFHRRRAIFAGRVVAELRPREPPLR
jgi:hypothetical protein